MFAPKMNLPEWCYSIRVKLTLTASILVALISFFVYWYFPSRLEEQALSALADKANTIAELMAYSITRAVDADDRPAVCDIVISAKQNPAVEYIMVLDSAANIVASFDSARAIAAGYVHGGFEEGITDDGLTYQTAVPIISHSEYLGRVYVGISLQSLHDNVASARKAIASVCMGIFIVGILLVVVLSTFVTKSLFRMVKIVERISLGDWKQRAKISAKDEVGSLALAFDRMLDKLELAYQDLQKSEKGYRDLFAANPHPMWVHDLDTRRIIDVNEAAEQCYGYSRPEFLAMTIHDLIIDGPFDKVHLLLNRQDNLFRSTGWRHRKRDGTIIDVEMSSHPLPLTVERRARLVLATDITKTLRAETLLRESEERYRDLFENSSDLIQSVSADGKFNFVNRAWRDTLGYSEEEVKALEVFDILKKEDFPKLKTISFDVLEGVALSQAQTVFMSKTGEEVVVEGSIHAKREKDGSLSTRGIFRNISERKRAEQSILLEKMRFQQLFENAPIGIVLADNDDRVVHANQTFQKMFHFGLDELNGKTLFDTIVPDDLLTEGRSISEQTLQGTSIQTETVRRCKEGTLIDVKLFGIPILVNGVPAGLFGMYVDISARKQAEKKQYQLMKDLEGINKELNDFAYIVSHDLKAPLRAIGSLASWLSTDYGEKLGDDGKEMLSTLLGRTKRMHDLIEAVLKYSRIGRTREVREAVNFQTLLPEIIDMIDPPQHIEVMIPSSLPVITGEKTRIQQVFQNLLSNAIKFMDKPEGKIVIDCKQVEGYWRFSVADNGPGIDKKHFLKIFQIFQTLAPRDEFESTGIGLTIVKRIVELHGGQVWVESTLGEGTTFFCTFPVGTFEETSYRERNILHLGPKPASASTEEFSMIGQGESKIDIPEQ